MIMNSQDKSLARIQCQKSPFINEGSCSRKKVHLSEA